MSRLRQAVLPAAVVFLGGLPAVFWRHHQIPPDTGPASLPPLMVTSPAVNPAPTGDVFVNTSDAQAFDQLWRQLHALLSRPLPGQEFRSCALMELQRFLALDGAEQARFQTAFDQALADLATARARLAAQRRPADDSSAVDDVSASTQRSAWQRWQADQQAAAAVLTATLDHAEPRQRLLHDKRLTLLLRLEYGLHRTD